MYPCIREKELKAASYVRGEKGGLEISLEEEMIPFATWDPDEEGEGEGYQRFAIPMRVTLEKGDMLYLPALWFVPSTFLYRFFSPPERDPNTYI